MLRQIAATAGLRPASAQISRAIWAQATGASTKCLRNKGSMAAIGSSAADKQPEIVCHRGLIALGQARNQRFLRTEVAIEVAGTHPGLGGDDLHRSPVEAVARESAFRGRQDPNTAIVFGLPT